MEFLNEIKIVGWQAPCDSLSDLQVYIPSMDILELNVSM